ncbi:hypothetical protein [Pseudonocardia kunmingensis]|uniref:hypothetical protein n=1 Tax=Pseudonocardia kunmingensis TaxID=630975 RepID=UPI00147982DA|nr:hypothetical protein [Pseudonocardia kunmingensis]
MTVRRNNSSEHERDGDESERTWRKHKARLDLARLYLAVIGAGLGCAVGLLELIRAVLL